MGSRSSRLSTQCTSAPSISYTKREAGLNPGGTVPIVARFKTSTQRKPKCAHTAAVTLA